METSYQLSEDNLELMFQVNYLAQFYLARLLLQKLINSNDGRLVILSCESHRYKILFKSEAIFYFVFFLYLKILDFIRENKI